MQDTMFPWGGGFWNLSNRPVCGVLVNGTKEEKGQVISVSVSVSSHCLLLTLGLRDGPRGWQMSGAAVHARQSVPQERSELGVVPL